MLQHVNMLDHTAHVSSMAPAAPHLEFEILTHFFHVTHAVLIKNRPEKFQFQSLYLQDMQQTVSEKFAILVMLYINTKSL